MKTSNERVEKGVASIEKMYELQEQLAIHFSAICGYKILREQIFYALFIRFADKYSFEWQGDLWDIDINYDEALEFLCDFDFKVLNNDITSEREILPDCLLMKRKALIKLQGLVWIIHKYDKDPFPSNPHAHQLENNIKLDLSNGKCYKIRKHIYTISKKNLLEIRSKASKHFEEIPNLTI